LKTTFAVDREKAVDYVADGVKVKVSYPAEISETLRQQKINKMYENLFS
jgi:hypothetical protein